MKQTITLNSSFHKKWNITIYNSYPNQHRFGCLSTGTGAMLVNDFYPGGTSKYFPARLKLSGLSSSPVVNATGGTSQYFPARLKLSGLSSSPVVNDFYFGDTFSPSLVNDDFYLGNTLNSPARLRFSGLSSSPVVNDFYFGKKRIRRYE